MFDLRVASIGIRKACARQGVKTASWIPIHDIDLIDDSEILAEIYPARGGMFVLTTGEVIEASFHTWKEIQDSL